MESKVFINLSNGIEYMPDLLEFNFVRIQSTLCEQKLWDQVIMDLDNNLLMHLSAGYEVFVFDCSKRGRGPRSLWQGLELIKFLCNNIWYGKVSYSTNDSNQIPYFKTVIKALKNPTINKIKYYRKFLNPACKTVHLHGRCKTEYKHYGDYERFKDIVSANFWPKL